MFLQVVPHNSDKYNVTKTIKYMVLYIVKLLLIETIEYNPLNVVKYISIKYIECY